MGRYFGIAAVDLLVQRDYGNMVSYKNGQVTAIPLEKVVGRLSLVDVNSQYDTERYNARRTILGAKHDRPAYDIGLVSNLT